MKIIAKKKDYYDGFAKHGIDNKNIYVRKTEKIKKKLKRIELPTSTFKSSIFFNYFVIWFCGTEHIGYEFSDNEKTFYLYDKAAYEKIEKINPRAYNLHKLWEAIMLKNLITDGFSIAQEYGSPYFLIRPSYNSSFFSEIKEYSITINPNLVELEFYKVKDVRQAFIEIESFLPSITFKEKISEMSDSEKIISHGMDLKTSFRCQAPGNKKERRRSNKKRKRLNKKN